MLRTTQRENSRLQDIKIKAEQGDAESQCELGCQYINDINVVRDDKEAAKWFEQAAAQNHIRSQAIIAQFYNYGIGVEENLEKAFYWYRKAAENNHAHAQFRLGVFYKEGQCTRKDPAQALTLFKKAAEQDEPNAQYELSLIYYYGRDVEKDAELAFKWAKRAAEQDFIKVYSLLGNLYIDGIGTQKNPEEGLKLFEKAANNGNIVAMYNLALFYLEGENATINVEKGLEYLERCAHKNMAPAQYKLALAYRPVTGYSSDSTKYYYWLRKAWYGDSKIIYHNAARDTNDIKSDILQSLNQDIFYKSSYHYNVLKKDTVALRMDPSLLVDQFHVFDAIKIKEDDELLNLFEMVTVDFTGPRTDHICEEVWAKGLKIRLQVENHAFIRLVNRYNQICNPANPDAQELINNIIDSAQEPHAQYLTAEQIEGVLTTLYEYWNYGLITTGMTEKDDIDNLQNLVTVILSFAKSKINELSQEHRLMLASMLITTLSYNTKQLNLSIKDTLTTEHLTRLCTIFCEENWQDGRYRSNPDDLFQSRVVSTLATLVYQSSTPSTENDDSNAQAALKMT